ncbi:translation initiation factor IF-2 [Candidatus Woesearchaeota archaeon]|nr:translation initiation factor IF-2 [Candidatus Woesearchaeota archaeon]
MIRQPIVVLVGHVDHGKSSILEKIREISITKHEAGFITQKIFAIDVPFENIRKICGSLLDQLKIKLSIPGLLMIDTPGHEAFTNLRKRGGNLADIAILVIDINEGLKPQTVEAIEILKQYKTPFVIALNKIDLIPGWKSQKTFLINNINSQPDSVKQRLDNKLYEILGQLYNLNIKTERFDRIEDYTKQIAMIPCSAKTTEGFPELLMVITGLAQRYMEDSLKIEVKGDAKGTILEVKDEKGLGTTVDVIIYDGLLKVNDQIIIGGIDDSIITKVRSLFIPEKGKLKQIKEISAASAVKIYAPGLNDAVAGMPIRVVSNDNIEKLKKEIQKEIQEVIMETDKQGIVLKADSLGSLEALISLLKARDVKIKKASIGSITKKDISDASAEKNPLNKVILAFNVKSEIKSEIKIISSNIIYKIIDEFQSWIDNTKKSLEAKELENLVRPCKIEIMKGYVFRQSNPAIVGADILIGTLKTNTQLMKNGKQVAVVKSIQYEKENINEVNSGKQVAVSIPNVIVGRQINEGDILYSDIPERDFIQLKKLTKYLNRDEVELLKEIVKIKRKDNQLWGV